MTDEIKSIIANQEVIDINQDSLGQQGHKIKYTKIELQENQYELTPKEIEIADCNGKKYLTKTYNEHLNTISKLKREGNWCDK